LIFTLQANTLLSIWKDFLWPSKWPCKSFQEWHSPWSCLPFHSGLNQHGCLLTRDASKNLPETVSKFGWSTNFLFCSPCVDATAYSEGWPGRVDVCLGVGVLQSIQLSVRRAQSRVDGVQSDFTTLKQLVIRTRPGVTTRLHVDVQQLENNMELLIARWENLVILLSER